MNKKKTYMEIANMLSLITQLGLMVLTLIFMLLGVGGAFMGVYKTLIAYTKRK